MKEEYKPSFRLARKIMTNTENRTNENVTYKNNEKKLMLKGYYRNKSVFFFRVLVCLIS